MSYIPIIKLLFKPPWYRQHFKLFFAFCAAPNGRRAWACRFPQAGTLGKEKLLRNFSAHVTCTLRTYRSTR